jgi:RNA polymerase sigma factor (sigma-70 family)
MKSSAGTQRARNLGPATVSRQPDSGTLIAVEGYTLRQQPLAALRGQSPLLRLASDERLIALTRAGQQAAFEALVARYQPRLLAFCRHMLRSREDAEDVLQEVFAAAFNAIMADSREINARPWLYRIARNRSLNHLRRTTAIGVDSMDAHFADAGQSTSEKVHKREEFRLLLEDIGHLPETQRSALVLREMDALSYEQIADVMDTTIPSVKSLLVRARIGLAEAAQARKLTCEEVRFELGEAAEGVRSASPPVRRHVKQCERCRAFRVQLRANNRALAAVMPIGALFALKKTLLLKLGLAKFGAGGAGTGAAAASAGGGAVASAGGGAVTVGGVAAGAVAAKVAAVVATVAIVAATTTTLLHHRRAPLHTTVAAAKLAAGSALAKTLPTKRPSGLRPPSRSATRRPRAMVWHLERHRFFTSAPAGLPASGATGTVTTDSPSTAPVVVAQPAQPVVTSPPPSPTPTTQEVSTTTVFPSAGTGTTGSTQSTGSGGVATGGGAGTSVTGATGTTTPAAATGSTGATATSTGPSTGSTGSTGSTNGPAAATGDSSESSGSTGATTTSTSTGSTDSANGPVAGGDSSGSSGAATAAGS